MSLLIAFIDFLYQLLCPVFYEIHGHCLRPCRRRVAEQNKETEGDESPRLPPLPTTAEKCQQVRFVVWLAKYAVHNKKVVRYNLFPPNFQTEFS